MKCVVFSLALLVVPAFSQLEIFLEIFQSLAQDEFIKTSVSTASNVLDTLKNYLDKPILTFRTPIAWNLAVIQSLEESPDQEVLENLTDEGVDKMEVSIDYRIAQHSISVYRAGKAWSKESERKKLKFDDDIEIVTSSYVSPFTDLNWLTIAKNETNFLPYHALRIDHKLQMVILAIRGTRRFKEFYINVMADMVPFMDGIAHKGFVMGTQLLLQKNLPIINRTLAKYPNYTLALAGHSLGGSMATLATMTLLSQDLDLPNVPIKCVALAPAPSYIPDSGKDIPQVIKDAITMYVHDRDHIPRLSIATAAELLAKVEAVDKLKLSRFRIARIWFGIGKEEDVAAARIAISNIEPSPFPFLGHVAGKIFYLSIRREEFFFGVRRLTNPEVLKRIYVTRYALWHHLSRNYEKAFKLIADEWNNGSNDQILNY